MDAKNVVLHDEVQEEDYMKQLSSCEDVSQSNYVCKLHKAFYGLKQAPRAWHDITIEYLLTIGFCVKNVDYPLYVCKSDKNNVCITNYADDQIVGGDK